MSNRFASNPADWPPPLSVFPVSRAEIAVENGPHPFHIAEEAGAAANWQAEIALNPALYDGRMVLQRDVHIHDGVIRSRTHLVPYSTFLWWRKKRGEGAFHLHGWPVIVSSDGALIAIRMGAHTANPGKVYFPAGSLEEEDVAGGFCDLDGNMAREVMEETGLDLETAVSGDGLYALHARRVVCAFRLFRFAATANELIARIREHIRNDPDPEIDDAVAIRNADPADHDYPDLMPPILDWFFNTSDQGS